MDEPPLTHLVQVVVDAPLHQLLTYAVPQPQAFGQLLHIPLGKQRRLGIVLGRVTTTTLRVKMALPVEHWHSLSESWIELCKFIALYYFSTLGEVIFYALPTALKRNPERILVNYHMQHTLYSVDPNHYDALVVSLPKGAKKQNALVLALSQSPLSMTEIKHRGGNKAFHYLERWCALGFVQRSYAIETQHAWLQPGLTLSVQQQQALDAIQLLQGFACYLLHGVTGSGKTEVYLQLVERILTADTLAQVLILVPEINLTPQLIERFASRFGQHCVSVLHSGLSDGERCQHWLNAHYNKTRIVLGTRLAVLASLERLRLIIVDEEHDSSFKQQEGARYHARDVAVWRAKQLAIPIVLGSATPSLESWQQAQSGRYQLLRLTQRVHTKASLPAIELCEMRKDTLYQQTNLTIRALDAIKAALAAKQQILVYLNRRGFAPVLQCRQCGWIAQCDYCDAWRAFHLHPRSLQCHHCGVAVEVPAACPQCKALDLVALGQGTQKIESTLAELFPQASIQRLDADIGRHQGKVAQILARFHDQQFDFMVGTQMVTKGHDFVNVALVLALNVDTSLFSHDFRANERLFSQLMQAAGRAGRRNMAGKMLIQTHYPKHALFQSLLAHDYECFAQQQLQQRQASNLPPFSSLCLLTAQHAIEKTLIEKMTFLRAALLTHAPENVLIYSVVPAMIARVAQMYRAQMLFECSSRAVLHAFITEQRHRIEKTLASLSSWNLDMDAQQV